MLPPTQWLDRLKARAPGPGSLALASFAICALSGLALLFAYRPAAPLESAAVAMMRDPVFVWMRAIHFWSAQALLVSATGFLIGCVARRAEDRMGFGAWIRLVLTGPVILFGLVSGFILRGDAAAQRVAAMAHQLLEAIPPGGRLLSLVLFGPGEGLSVVFWQHGAAALVLALLLGAHFRRLVPGPRAAAATLLVVVALSAAWVPALAAYAGPDAAGPWYLAGFATLLRWVPEPGLAVGVALVALLVLLTLPLFEPPLRAALKLGLAAALAACVAIAALEPLRRPGVRAEGAAPAPAEARFTSFRSHLPVPAPLRALPVALVAGRPEGCLSCHGDMTGFAPAHQPAAMGCTACHRGNPFTLDARLAHDGMTLTPGNLPIVRDTCATAGCHADIAARVTASLMNTMSGVVAVDTVVFGESRDLNRIFAVSQLGHSPADQHLRTLCASCHFGTDKLRPAAIGESSRGGGCSACHLNYGAAALTELRRWGPAAAAPRHHPDISVNIPAGACFGCHSRSGRLSTNYEGWHETLLDEAAARKMPGWPGRYRVLEDGRVFVKTAADVHFEKGMTCTDCHLAAEVMGDGAAHAHEAEAVSIACTDCHADRPPAADTINRLDPETQAIVALRRLNEPGRRFVRTRSGRLAYPNVFLDGAGAVVLQAAASGAQLRPKAPSSRCGRDIPEHQTLECRTCHSAWAPQCISCHTSFDPNQDGWDHLAGRLVRGVWQEVDGDFRAEPPVLGIERIRSGAGASVERVSTFVPGMVMTLNRTTGAAKLPDEFHRLYAPADPHTIVTRARDCRSCHANPLALGYGRGSLVYETGGGRGRWVFTPAFARSPVDGLPLDAWIGFLEEPASPAATRTNVRPFNREEQRRVLLVGACLACHSADEPRLAAVFADFSDYRARISPRCVLPDWTQ